MSTNISKQKREDLLNKIKKIRSFIASAPQDKNTGNLLSYLSDLEKDVNDIISHVLQYWQSRKSFIDLFWINRYTDKYRSNFNFFFCSDYYI